MKVLIQQEINFAINVLLAAYFVLHQHRFVPNA